MNHLGSIGNSRTAEQAAHMQSTVGQGRCGFCDIDRTLNPVDHEVNNHWRAWENAWPYPGHMYHLVIPAIRHWTKLSDITPEGITDGFKILNTMVKRLRIPGGAIVLRFGNFENTGGTLAHLHFQVQVPNRLGQSFVTAGRPNESQIDETIELLVSDELHRASYTEIGRSEHWSVRFDERPRPHTIHEFGLFTHEEMSLESLARNKEAQFELFGLLRNIEERYNLPGGVLILKFGDRLYHLGTEFNMHARLIVAFGTGPVLEVLHPAWNVDQAKRSLKTLVKKPAV